MRWMSLNALDLLLFVSLNFLICPYDRHPVYLPLVFFTSKNTLSCNVGTCVTKDVHLSNYSSNDEHED